MSLEKADRYGHHLANISVNSSQVSSQQPIQAASLKSLKHKRSTTAYGYFNNKAIKNTKKRNLQGPHTTAHITTSMALDLGEQRGRNLKQLLKSKLVLSPKKANHILREILKKRGKNWKKETRKPRTDFLKNYSRLHNIAQKDPSASKREDAIHKLIELHPAGTYGLESGTVTSGQIAGKGERRTQSEKDLLALKKLPKGSTNIPSNVKTFDSGGTSTRITNSAAIDRARNLGRYAMTNDTLSDAESYDSSSDSEVDL